MEVGSGCGWMGKRQRDLEVQKQKPQAGPREEMVSERQGSDAQGGGRVGEGRCGGGKDRAQEEEGLPREGREKGRRPPSPPRGSSGSVLSMIWQPQLQTVFLCTSQHKTQNIAPLQRHEQILLFVFYFVFNHMAHLNY